MIFPKESDWSVWGIRNDVHKFFFLRWQELFDEDTFDSWQVRTSNVKTILNEIIESIDIVKDYHSYHANIRDLINEAIDIATFDIIIKKHFTFLLKHLEIIKQTYEAGVKGKETRDLESFKSLVKVISAYLDGYSDKLKRVIGELLEKGEETGFKIELYQLTMALGVDLKSCGYSDQTLRKSLDILKDANEPCFHKRYYRLLSEYSGALNEYECSYYIQWPPSTPSIDLSQYNISLSTERKKDQLSDAEYEFYEKFPPNGIIANTKVQSLDSYSARCLGEDQLESLFAVSRLFRPSKKVGIISPLVLVYTGTQQFKCFKEDTSRLQYIRDRRTAPSMISSFATLYGKLASEDAGQFSASLQHHKLAQLASTDEARLINLWISLEALVQNGSNNIIERISTYVSTSVTGGHIYSMLRALAMDINKIWKFSDTSSLLQNISKRSNKNYLHVYDLLSILRDKEKGDLINSLLEISAVNTLCVFRISRQWKIFQDIKSIQKFIENHKQIVEWQLRRIYRARNNIVHTGTCAAGTSQLIQNLHTYYTLTINHLIHDLFKNPNWSIADSFEHRALVYNYFIKSLTKDQPPSIEVILDPVKAISANN
ncbi:MAG: hypothetical protein ABFD75_00960 [Smithella sp.]